LITLTPSSRAFKNYAKKPPVTPPTFLPSGPELAAQELES
jgi:hypothetical protein